MISPQCLVVVLLISVIGAQCQSSGMFIVGGRQANVGEFPYHVSIQKTDGTHICGGAILSERFVISAAHCFTVANGIETLPPRNYKIRVGSVQRLLGGQLVRVKRIIVHQDYRQYSNDLALLELESTLSFNALIQKVALPSIEVPTNARVTITGWGLLTNDGVEPHRLQVNLLSALTTAQCADQIYIEDSSLLCLSHKADHGICFGDFGGPAVFDGELVGIAAFIVGGCGTTDPDGYTKIFYHLDWIKEHMK